MENKINNVNLKSIQETINNAKSDPSILKKKIQIEGEWILDKKLDYQFKAEAKYGKGTAIFEIDSPTWMGGNDTRPGPMLYCIAGVASCFMSTFVTIASLNNIIFKSLKIRVECDINFSKVLELSNEPIIEEVNFFVDATALNASNEELQKIVEKAKSQCPAIYSLTNIIKTNVYLNKTSK